MSAPLPLPNIAQRSTHRLTQRLTRRLSRVRASLCKTPTRFVGIDIGVQTITIASMGVGSNNKGSSNGNGLLTWQSLATIPLPFDPSTPPSAEWIAATVRTLQDRLPRTVDGEISQAAISLPSTWVHYQVVPGSSLQACQSQADQLFQNSVFNSTAHQSHWPVIGKQHGAPKPNDQYVVASTSRNAAVQIADAVASVGYEVRNIFPQGAALLHAARDLTSLDPQCVVLLNRFGAMVAVNHHSGMDGSGQRPENECGLCRCLPAIDTETAPQFANRQLASAQIGLDDIRPWLSEVAGEVDATLNYSTRVNMANESNWPILICGELAGIEGIDVELATLTNRPVARWQYQGQKRPYRPSTGISQLSTTRRASAIATVDTSDTGDTRSAMALSLAHQSATSHWMESGLDGGPNE